MGDIERDKCDFCNEVKDVERNYLRPSIYVKPNDIVESSKLWNEGSYFIIIKTCKDCGKPKI